ncbi:MAG TPA: hypothetical protein VNE83_01435 [Terriglobales bacterium]|nr:hypothetical protein [Terriglobales bacterium]
MRRALGLLLIALSGCLCAPARAQAPVQQNAFFAGVGTQGASLHGNSLLPGTSVLAGETVSTGHGGVAVLTPTHGAGGVVEVGPDSQATVASGPYDPALGADQLQILQGSVLVSGAVSVVTAQGRTFLPQTSQTSFVVDAGSTSSTMGVLTGAVRIYNPSGLPTIVPAGQALQVTGSLGAVQLSRVPLNQVQRPSLRAAAPQTTPASQSQ